MASDCLTASGEGEELFPRLILLANAEQFLDIHDRQLSGDEEQQLVGEISFVSHCLSPLSVTTASYTT